MIRVAIVEDEQPAADALAQQLERFEKEQNIQGGFHVTRFSDAVTFLEGYRPVYDIVFMDIEMPDLGGMDAAAKLREIDKAVILIFVTNLAQFAIKGYEVDALDFVVKPVSYYVLSLKLRRAIERLGRRETKELSIMTGNAIVRVTAAELKYVEVQSHRLVFHTTGGEYKAYGSLKSIEEQLGGAEFARCNAYLLVNLKYVTAIKGYSAFVGDEELPISHSKRKDFVKAVNDYMGGCR